MTSTVNPFLAGNFAPVFDELTATELEVDGAIPPDLDGRYLRTGPNPFEMPTGPYHWFVGNGMVHGVQLGDGKAREYRNRFVLTDELAAHRGVAPVSGSSEMGARSLGNTNVVAHAGKLLALTETTLPFELDSELETVATCEFEGTLPFGFTAHPKRDVDTGELHGFSYWVDEPYVMYHRIDADGRLVQTEPIPVKGPTSMHDFMVTERNLVWLDLPVVFDIDLAMEGVPFPFRWTPEYGSRVGVMPRDGDGGATRWFDVDLCYVFHPLNGYDDGDRIVLDVARHETMFAESREGPNDRERPTLDRWTIDLDAAVLKEERLDDRPQEFPRVPDQLVGRRHRYGYTVEVVDERTAFETAGLLKHDLDTGTSERSALGDGHQPGEFVFVPSADATSEDDGWLMGYVHDQANDRGELVILDAHDLTAAPVATVHLPRRVPFGFHGNWIPTDS